MRLILLIDEEEEECQHVLARFIKAAPLRTVAAPLAPRARTAFASAATEADADVVVIRVMRGADDARVALCQGVVAHICRRVVREGKTRFLQLATAAVARCSATTCSSEHGRRQRHGRHGLVYAEVAQM
jgi:hypothetical protein